MMARAWSDRSFKKLLQENPQGAAASMGYRSLMGKVLPKPKHIKNPEALEAFALKRANPVSNACGFTCCC